VDTSQPSLSSQQVTCPVQLVQTSILSLGFINARSDTSFFVYQLGSDSVYLLLYIDDIILTASSLLHWITSALQHEFSMKDLDPLTHFLGVSISLRSAGLVLSWRQYIQEISIVMVRTLQYLTFMWPGIKYIVHQVSSYARSSRVPLYACEVHPLASTWHTWLRSTSSSYFSYLSGCLLWYWLSWFMTMI
jgi:hypothetical protein